MTTAGAPRITQEEITVISRKLADGSNGREVVLSVPNIRCGGCVARIEKAISSIEGIVNVRVNLTTKRIVLQWRGERVPLVLEALVEMGYEPQIIDSADDLKDKVLAGLVRALAVAGFGFSNIMILSVAVWSGVEDSTRFLFHCISALIALPVILYAGRIFFISAIKSLRVRDANMDVPISLGIILSYGLSLYDTMHNGEYAYFDAAVSLIFFLLIGRTLDHMMRVKASKAVENLTRLVGHSAVVEEAGGYRTIPLREVAVGDVVIVAAGQRVPVNACVLGGISEIDVSMVTGESMPVVAYPGQKLQAGTLNLTVPLKVRALSGEVDSFLAEMARLMEGAIARKGRYRRLADHAARLYTPCVHTVALLTFVGWFILTSDTHSALSAAIAALIITCPCALGLAVPIVQMMTARFLFDQGIVLKNGEALERLKEVDTVVFDKTGTLTLSQPCLRPVAAEDIAYFDIARQMAFYSRHPYSRALTEEGGGLSAVRGDVEIQEMPGQGIEMVEGQNVYRLGKASWVSEGHAQKQGNKKSSCALSLNGKLLTTFFFDDVLRPDTMEVIRRLRTQGINVEILSGDVSGAVDNIAEALNIPVSHSAMTPKGKVEYLGKLSALGHKVLMVGDGLNDAPALAAAHVSITPSGASDVSQKAADFVLLGDGQSGILYAIAMAKVSHRFIMQNFALAVVYNICALPIAMAGLVTPIIAAIAMSASSILVVANALRMPRNPFFHEEK